jgi:pseudaminic acid biosynthesis-associated methylase
MLLQDAPLQINAWRGEFGSEYTKRNEAQNINARTRLWARILRDIDPGSILEVGAGSGANMTALSRLSTAWLVAVEPNALARGLLKKGPADRVTDGVAQKVPLPANSADMVFTSGVLIHIPPAELGDACDEIYRISKRWVVCIEYFAAEPEEKQYRGHDGLLFKRDFGSFWMDRFPDLKALDYGFAWKRMTGLDDLTFWIFEKERT